MSNTFTSLMARTSDAILSVPTIADLPADALEGAIRYVEDVDALYTYDGAVWNTSGGVQPPSPAITTDNAVARWDGAIGASLSNSGVIIDDLDNITGVASLNTITSTEINYLDNVTSNIQTQLNDKIDDSEKGAALGVATLDGGGKVPAAQLPNSIMDYLGNWSAATNTPTLANGTGNTGDVYQNTAVGIVDFGAGNITFAVGDFAIYNGTIWEKSLNSNAVTSVNGLVGIVTAGTIGDTAGGASTAGSILFVGAGQTIAQDNASLFWDDTNNRLGVGTAAPSNSLTVSNASATLTGSLFTNTNATGTGRVALFSHAGLGRGVEVSLSNAANTGAALRIDAVHTGEAIRASASVGRVISATNTGTNVGINMINSNTASPASAISGFAAGTGVATYGAVQGEVTGSGIGSGILAVRNSAGRALVVGTNLGAGVGISPQFAMTSGNNYSLELPLVQGAAGESLQNNGSGVLSWVTALNSGSSHTLLSDIGTNTHAQIDTHIASTANPHAVTATQVGLGNVDNTSNATERAATATLTNKTLTAPVINNGSITGTTIDSAVIGSTTRATASFTSIDANSSISGQSVQADGSGGAGFFESAEQGTSPSTPAANFSRVYPKSDAKWYTKDDAGTEQQIASAATTDNRVIRGDGTNLVSGQIDDPAFFTSGANATSTLPGLIPTYEKGTFTPSYTGGGSSGGTQLGRYVKIGSLCSIETSWTSFTTDGNDTITFTLPFPAKSAGIYPIITTDAGTVGVGRFSTTAGSSTGSPARTVASTPFTGVGANNTININISYEVDE